MHCQFVRVKTRSHTRSLANKALKKEIPHMGERETALGSPPCGHRAHTYTHIPLFPRPGITWTFPLSSPVFPFGQPNPKYPPPDHPGGAGSKTIGRKPITHTKLLPFPFFCVCCVPPTHRTHTCFRFPSCYHDCPETHLHWFAFASFRSPFSDFMVHEPLEPCA